MLGADAVWPRQADVDAAHGFIHRAAAWPRHARNTQAPGGAQSIAHPLGHLRRDDGTDRTVLG